MNSKYRVQNHYIGALILLLSKRTFVEMAVSHFMARNLESDDQRKRAEQHGEEVLKQWETQYRKQSLNMATQISSAFWSSFWIIVATVGLSTLAAVYLGQVHWSFSLDIKRLVTYIGSSLVAWGTLMELGGHFTLWDGSGNTFPELAHKFLFRCLFVPGVFLILTSVLI